MQTFYQSHISNFNLAAASEGLEVDRCVNILNHFKLNWWVYGGV